MVSHIGAVNLQTNLLRITIQTDCWTKCLFSKFNFFNFCPLNGGVPVCLLNFFFFCDPITTIVMIMIRLTKDLFFSFDLFGSIDWPQSPFHLQTNFGDFYFRVFVWWSFFVRLFVSLKKKCWQSVRLGLWFQCLQRSRSSSKKIGKRKQLTTCGVGYIFWLLSVCLCELLLQCQICPTKRKENYKKKGTNIFLIMACPYWNPWIIGSDWCAH